MSKLNPKLQIRRDQLAWLLSMLLDERAVFQLVTLSGLVPDLDRLCSLSKRTLLDSLTDAFFVEAAVEETTCEFFAEQAEAAIARVGYMEVAEIEMFFDTSETLIEAGEFAEVVWALLTDERTDVATHGYSLLHTSHAEADARSADQAALQNQLTAEKTEKIRAEYAYNLEIAKQEFDNQTREMELLQRKREDLQGQYTALEKKHKQVEQHLAFLLAENEALRDKDEAAEGDRKRLKELEQANNLFREREAQYAAMDEELQQLRHENESLLAAHANTAAQLKEYDRIKAAKETFGVDLTLVEEAVYKGNQGLEELQTSLDAHFKALERNQDTTRGALTRIRDTLTLLDTPPDADDKNALTPAQPRVGVFVDVQNMFYAAKDRFARRVDYIKLLDLIVGPRHLEAAYAYVVQIPEIDQSSFLSLLGHNGYTIKSKDLRLRGDGSAKGDWDVGIAVDVVSMLGTLDVVILASGDGDFCPLAELIKQQDKRVEVVAFEHNTSMDLQHIADQFFPIGNELLI